jgi:hypothetical protein
MSVATEAILNKNSALFHEENGYTAGLLGYWQPFTKAVFGDYRLVEALGSQGTSPFDINHRLVSKLDADQLEAFFRALLITIENYIDVTGGHQHSFVIFRTLSSIEGFFLDTYKLDGVDSELFSSDIYLRLRATIRFLRELTELLDKKKLKVRPSHRRSWKRYGSDGSYGLNLHYRVAQLAFKALVSASHVKGSDNSWFIQYGTVWSEFFGSFDNSPASREIQRLLRRMIFNSIQNFATEGFVAAHILAICLNCMGLTLPKKGASSIDQPYRALHAVVLRWTKKNYLQLRQYSAELADACLTGTMTFDEAGNRLVKTYAGFHGQEPPKEYLDLDPSTGSGLSFK